MPAGLPIPRDLSRLLGALLGVTAVLLVVNLVVKAVGNYVVELPTLLTLFDVNREENVPTLWNAALMMAVSGACLLVGVLTPTGASPPRRSGWLVVGAIAALMGFDEVSRWHEQLREVGLTLSRATGLQLPTYSWVVPGALAGLALVTVAARWSRGLPADVRKGFILGVLMFGTGAVALEALSGWVDQRYGSARLYALVTVVEEALEMVGCVVVFGSVLTMLRRTSVEGSPGLALRACPGPTQDHGMTSDGPPCR